MRAGTPDSPPWNVRVHRSASESSYRSSYTIDRDRIIHAEAFRDLQHKTQVQGIAGAGVGVGFRTRLNHVIEVAQIGTGIAAEVRADSALVEAIALAHDLGHPPFGHAGERALRRALEAHAEDAWNANVHSLAVVDEIEAAYVGFRGLDLTWATREGIARHSTPFDEPVSFGDFAKTANGGIECQVVDAADVLAYLSHDLDDALNDEFLTFEDIAGLSDWLDRVLKRTEEAWRTREGAWPESERGRLLRRTVVAQLISAFVHDIGQATRARMAELELETAAEVRASAARVVAQSEAFRDLTANLLRKLVERYYRSPAVREMDARAERTIHALFDWYVDHPLDVPERFRTNGEAITAANFIASLNDRSAAAAAASLGLITDPPANDPALTAPP